MKPFEFSSSLAETSDRYPCAKQLLRVMRDGGDSDQVAIARQWLSEGIPFAFKECPAVYESLRSWLSAELDIEPKSISLTGSARLGSSLSTRKGKFGKPFGPDSDLDLFVVSEQLFQLMCDDFRRWSTDFRSGKMSPIDVEDKKNWISNARVGPSKINRGFVDSWMVPDRVTYANIRKINAMLSLLLKRLAATELAPNIPKTSLRCYKSWGSFERQMLVNFGDIVKKLTDRQQ